MKENKKIKDMHIFNNFFLCPAYVDDTSSSLSDKESVLEVLNTVDKFFRLFGLNRSKYGMADIGVLEEVLLTPALCGIKCIGLTIRK